MIKDEVRVLVVDYVTDDLMIYVIQRGIKGVEHLGVVHGGLKELQDHLRSNNLINEVKYIVLPEGRVLRVVERGEVRPHDLRDEEAVLIRNIVLDGKHIIDLVRSELKLIMTQKQIKQ